MYDLYSYNNKHNEANGWNNTDGANDNRSWNCGMEGDTKDPEVLKLRYRMIRNACAILMCSRGTPMFSQAMNSEIRSLEIITATVRIMKSHGLIGVY